MFLGVGTKNEFSSESADFKSASAIFWCGTNVVDKNKWNASFFFSCAGAMTDLLPNKAYVSPCTSEQSCQQTYRCTELS